MLGGYEKSLPPFLMLYREYRPFACEYDVKMNEIYEEISLLPLAGLRAFT